ncbi:hypothetical protein WN943_023206 [Citrus x changshan-huyou]
MSVTTPGTRGSLYEVLRVETTMMISEIKMAYQSLAKIHGVNHGHRIKNSLDAQDCATSSVNSPRFDHADEQ